MKLKYIVIIGLLCITSLTAMTCKTSPTQITLKVETGLITSVDAGMQGWSAYVNKGLATTTQIDNVKTAYNAYYTAQLSAEAALSALVTSGSTNMTDVQTANIAVSAAETQILTLLNNYILK